MSSAMQTKALSHTHMPPLDGLRGVAVLLVAIGHFLGSLNYEFGYDHFLVQAGELGWTGVDLFFVLSGFLITGILYDAKGTQDYFKNFYARRALRIFPLYYTALIVVLIIAVLIPTSNALGTASPIWEWTYLTNVVMAKDGAGAFGFTDHFWSLAVEEHFYLVWPFLVFMLPRKNLMVIAAIAMALALVLRLMLMRDDGFLHYGAYVLTPMRMDGLAAGAFLALLVRGAKPLESYRKMAMILAAVAALVFAAIILWRRTLVPWDVAIGTFGVTSLWVLFASALVLALTWKPFTTIFSNKVLRWFGKYSYGLYVWHPIVFMLIFHTEFARGIRGGESPLHAFLTSAFALAVVFGVTMASWRLLEQPCLRLKKHFEARVPVKAAEPAVQASTQTEGAT